MDMMKEKFYRKLGPTHTGGNLHERQCELGE